MAERYVNWMQALDAFERVYGIPNPYSREKPENQGLRWEMLLFKVGLPDAIYPQDKVSEMLAFVRGYSLGSIGVAGMLKAYLSSTFSNDANAGYANIRKIREAHKKGREARIGDDASLESRLKENQIIGNMGKYHIKWMHALAAFEREYKIENPYSREKPGNKGPENHNFTWRHLVKLHGEPKDAYPKEAVPEMLRFVNGYSQVPRGAAGVGIIDYLGLIDSHNRGQVYAGLRKLSKAYSNGKNARREDNDARKARIAAARNAAAKTADGGNLDSKLRKLLHLFNIGG